MKLKDRILQEKLIFQFEELHRCESCLCKSLGSCKGKPKEYWHCIGCKVLGEEGEGKTPDLTVWLCDACVVYKPCVIPV